MFGKLKEQAYWFLGLLVVLQILVMVWMVLTSYETVKQDIKPFLEDLKICLPAEQLIPYLNSHDSALQDRPHNLVKRIQHKGEIEVQYTQTYQNVNACLEHMFMLPIPLKRIKMEARENGVLLSLFLD